VARHDSRIAAVATGYIGGFVEPDAFDDIRFCAATGEVGVGTGGECIDRRLKEHAESKEKGRRRRAA
jgi:hypothetical protein